MFLNALFAGTSFRSNFVDPPRRRGIGDTRRRDRQHGDRVRGEVKVRTIGRRPRFLRAAFPPRLGHRRGRFGAPCEASACAQSSTAHLGRVAKSNRRAQRVQRQGQVRAKIGVREFSAGAHERYAPARPRARSDTLRPCCRHLPPTCLPGTHCNSSHSIPRPARPWEACRSHRSTQFRGSCTNHARRNVVGAR